MSLPPNIIAVLTVGVYVGLTNTTITCDWQAGDVRHGYIEAATATNLVNDAWAYWKSWSVTTTETNLVDFYSRATNETLRFWRFSTWSDMDGDGISNESEMSRYYTDHQLNDSDDDGIPDDFEIALGMNPTNADDWASVPKITCGNGGRYATLSAALEATTTNSIVEIQPGVYSWSEITLPTYPVIITSPDGGRNKRVILEGRGSGAYILSIPDAARSVIRGLYFDLRESSFLSAVWVGSGSISSGTGGSARIENCYFHMSRKPGTLSAGVYDYRYSKQLLTISGCVFNALGCDYARGCYFYDANPAVIEHCTFVNFPPANADRSMGIFYASTIQGYQGDDVVCPMVIKSSLFDESFTNTYAVAKGNGADFYDVTLRDCLVPNTICLAECDAIAYDCIESNSCVTTYGLLDNGSPAIDKGGPSSGYGFDIKGVDRDDNPDIGADEYVTSNAGDIDGDGMLDEFENELVTNPFLADTDYDGIPDSLEYEHSSSPTNAEELCCNLHVIVTNPAPAYLDARCALVISNQTGFTRASLEYTATNAVNEIIFPHAIYNLTNEYYLATKLSDGDDSWEGSYLWSRKSLTPTNHEYSITLVIPDECWDADGDGMADAWENQHELSPTNAADAFLDKDCDGLLNLHEYYAGTNPTDATEDGHDTALYAIDRGIDALLSSTEYNNSNCLYASYSVTSNTTHLLLNTNCWAHTIDLSSASPWNDWHSFCEAGTLITRRHVLFAKHYLFQRGEGNKNIAFRGCDGQIFWRHITETNFSNSTDIKVAILSEDVPSTVSSALLLPSNFYDYIRDGKGLPVLTLDQQEHPLVFDIGSSLSNQMLHTTFSELPTRLRYSEEIQMGDSGNPSYLIIGNTPVLVMTTWFGLYSSPCGPSLTAWRNELQSLVNELTLSAGLNTNDYQVETIDLSQYRRLQ